MRHQIKGSTVREDYTSALRKMKPKARYNGDFRGALLSAAFYAKKHGETAFLYRGSYYMTECWRVSVKPYDYLCPVNNQNGILLSVDPDMTVREYDLTHAYNVA